MTRVELARVSRIELARWQSSWTDYFVLARSYRASSRFRASPTQSSQLDVGLRSPTCKYKCRRARTNKPLRPVRARAGRASSTHIELARISELARRNRANSTQSSWLDPRRASSRQQSSQLDVGLGSPTCKYKSRRARTHKPLRPVRARAGRASSTHIELARFSELARRNRVSSTQSSWLDPRRASSRQPY